VGEIEEIVQHTCEAACRAKQAGFDAVELHGAHGYLFHQFLSPAGNVRADDYGGSTSNRCRILTDIITRIKRKCGPDFPILCKIDGDEHIEGGIDREEAIKIASLLEEAGADSILVSAGCGASLEYILPPAHMPSAPNLADAREIKRYVGIPVGVVGKIDDFEALDSSIGNHEIDYIGLARPLLSDPELPAKLQGSREDEIRHCIYCNEKCNGIDEQYGIGCSVNPVLGQESALAIRRDPPQSRKRIAVVGGGPAGLEAAKVAAERGHQVHLFEKNQALGGQVNLVSRIPGKETWSGIAPYYQRVLSKLDVHVACGEEATVETLGAVKPDVVVIATGAVPDMGGIHISDGARVLSAFDAIANVEAVEDEIVVVGGQRLAVDTGLYLAATGNRVTIVCRGDNDSYLAQNVARSIRPHVMRSLEQKAVRVIYGASVVSIDGEYVHLEVAGGDDKLTYGTAIMAAYLEPTVPPFLADIHGMDTAVYRIGDCVFPRGLGQAVSEGFEVGRLV
jgi:NADPH-dependent 2,4-dienoyl-CoA reductase/sulfur reductase-like enzyme